MSNLKGDIVVLENTEVSLEEDWEIRWSERSVDINKSQFFLFEDQFGFYRSVVYSAQLFYFHYTIKRNYRRIALFPIPQSEEYFTKRNEQTDIPEMEIICNLSINGILNSRCVAIKVIISKKLNNKYSLKWIFSEKFSETKINRNQSINGILNFCYTNQ